MILVVVILYSSSDAYNRNNPAIVTESGFEVPKRSLVKVNRVFTRNLSGPLSLIHISEPTRRS